MHVWSRFPFLRITFFFIVGILLSSIWDLSLLSSETARYTLVLLAVISFLIYQWLPNKAHWGIGLFSLFLILFLGSLRYHDFNQTDISAAESKLRQTDKYSAIVRSYPQTKSKYYIYQVEAQHCLSDSSIHPLKQIIQLYVEKGTSPSPPFQYGDLIEVKGQPFRINGPGNPHEFDYSHYMSLQGIYFQQFCRASDINLVRQHCANPLLAATFRLRAYFESLITTGVPEQEEQGIALALLLGIKDRLDPETKASYASVGAMHVLAVSGLHVGVIYFLLAFVFKPIKTAIVREVVLPMISIITLWLYALLTGFSPSILRAVTMFSSIIFGQAINRQSSIYNSIALSAFILLLFNPNQLFSVGFQLSYLAVTGIVYIYRFIFDLWIPGNLILHKVWTITAVSIAAQIATAPISIYYFNQFPSYFLVSNLFVIPAAFIIMGEGILLFIADSLFSTPLPGLLLTYTIRLVNWLINWVHQLPGSLIDWLYLSQLQVVMLYLAIGSCFVFVERKRVQWLGVCFCLLLVFSGSEIWSLTKQSNQHSLEFYHTRDNQVIDHIKGLHAQLLTLDSIQDRSLMEYQIHPYRLANNLPPVDQAMTISPSSNKIDSWLNPIVIQGKRILFLSEPLDQIEIKGQLKCDYLVVLNNASRDLNELKEKLIFDTLILSQNNKYYRIMDLEKQSLEMKIPHISMRKKAFTIELD